MRNSSSRLKYEIIELDSVKVTADVSQLTKSDEIHFSATSIAKHFGKSPKDWLKTDQAKEYINVTSQKENIPFEKLVRTVQGGKHKGTWLHNRLALAFARWCSVEFEYYLDKWIQRRINEEHQHQQRRLDLKISFRPLTDAIQAAHTDPKPHHYINEIDMLNRLVTGLSAKQLKESRGVDNIRDALTADECRLMDKLQQYNAALIVMNFDYAERKNLLQQQADKAFTLMEARGVVA